MGVHVHEAGKRACPRGPSSTRASRAGRAAPMTTSRIRAPSTTDGALDRALRDAVEHADVPDDQHAHRAWDSRRDMATRPRLAITPRRPLTRAGPRARDRR